MRHDSLVHMLERRFADAIARVTGDEPGRVRPTIRPTADPKFGDYQCNDAMPLAGRLRQNPRQIAQKIAETVDLEPLAERPEIAGPGFLNIRLRDRFLADYLGQIPAPGDDDRLGMPPVPRPQRVVIDYSSPNIAKQMHVGHLRSTIIGDVFARVLGFEGHEVIRQNHVGDFGTQFGMLIAWYEQHPMPQADATADVLEAIEEDYRKAAERFKTDAAFAEAARAAVGRLQRGEPAAREIWERMCTLSREAFTEIYRRLGVLLRDDDVRGESFYQDRLEAVVTELQQKLPPRDRSCPPAGGWVECRIDDGAVCLFFYDEKGEPVFRNPDGDELPMIIRKKDGAFLYATTDLAALRYRLLELGAQRVIYVTDARQKLHFQMLFAAARAAGWATPDAVLEHVTFGSVLGPDRKPLKTREGGNIKLRDLLDEAERRARALLEQREQLADEDDAAPLSEEEKRDIARRVGIAAVKYADLRNDRASDYVFDWDKLLALRGNTAPYMMYAYARVRSIYRKAAGQITSAQVYAAPLTLADPHERALALALARARETIDAVASELLPHILCGYLYDLAGAFMRFYEHCPVLRAGDEPTRLSRLRLCDLTARALRLGLGLLGIEVVERM